VPLQDGTGVVVVRRDGDRRHVEVCFLDGRTTPVLSRAGRLAVVTGAGGKLAVSDLDAGHLTVLDIAGEPRTLVEADGVPGQSYVEFSRDGKAVTAVNRDSVWLWDLVGGREPLSLRASGVEFSEARYEPDSGELLLLESRRGALWRLAVGVDAVVREVCADPPHVDWAAHFPDVPEQPLCP
jgi:hypothetical protein